MELYLDGKIYEAGEGQTVLELARACGVPVPSLCYHEGLKPYGACRLCLVEVIGGGRPGIHSSCTLPVSPGLEILTASQKVLNARKITAELLLARSPDNPAIRRIAAQCGVPHTDLPSHHESCILCGRCVRACAQLEVHAIGFARRGMDRRVTVPFSKASRACIACRACCNVCPTGAIESVIFPDRIQIKHLESEPLELEKALCTRCGKPYVPDRAWRHVQQKQPAFLKAAQPVCPSCRRSEQISRLMGRSHG